MADTLIVTLPTPLAEEVRAAAAAHGMAPEDYVRQQLALEMALGVGAQVLDDECVTVV